MDTIENHIRSIFDDIRKEHPEVRRISFDIVKYAHRKEVDLQGFIHGSGCLSYKSIDELKAILAEKKESKANRGILFRRFEL